MPAAATTPSPAVPTPAHPLHRTSASRASRLRRGQWALGLAVTLALALVQSTGFTRRTIELFSLDLRAQWFGASAPPSSSSIAVIAIDQQALDTVGRWPWPRERVAQMIDELRIAGARVVALDLLLDDPSLPRIVRDDAAPGGIRAVDDDQILADAIARHGSVVAAVSFPFDWALGNEAPPTAGPSRLSTPRVLEAVEGRPDAVDGPFDEAVDALRPLLPLDERDTSKGAAIDDLRLKLGVVRALAHHAPRSSILAPGDDAGGARWPVSSEPRSPAPPIAAAAARLASVTFDTYDFFDGRVRRIPLWVSSQGRLWPNLGLAAVAQFRAVDSGGVTIDASHTTLDARDGTTSTVHTRSELFSGRGPDGRSHSQRLDGIVYIPWPVALPDWRAQFEPPAVTRERLGEGSAKATSAAAETVAAGAVIDPVLIAERVAANLAEMDRAMRIAARDAISTQAEYDGLAAALRKETIGGPAWGAAYANLLVPWAAMLEDAKFQVQGANHVDLATLSEEERRVVQDARAIVDAGPRLAAEVDAGVSRIAERRREIREKVSGRICFVGWTATGSISDFVSTSVHPRTPGVLVHAAVANSLLTGLARDPGPAWLDALALLAMGLLGTWAGVRLGVLIGPLALAAAVVGWFLVTGEVFWDAQQTIVAFSAPSLAAVSGWGTVMLHRLLIEQRARRRTEERFRSYVSPAVVDILVNNPQLNSMAPQKRELTVMFTDLAGFTTTAERLGSERTAQLLAAYLRTMTEILQSTGATLDKYLGDGIMAFWGAPIADAHHAANACKAAVLMQRALVELNARGEFTDAGELVMRIGIASGELMVGDFGNPPRNSSYTVLGDTANLAARLEAANKFFGTKILVSSRVVQLAATSPVPGSAWRPIGRIVVKGKHQHEAIAELLDDTNSGGSSARIAATDAMVAAYVSGKFEECRHRADDLAREFSDVKLANLYRLAVDGILSGDSKDSQRGFEGTIELLEKG
jgi:class 3 adenylate cyclase/CHASE2 domain-containing sensor protein